MKTILFIVLLITPVTVVFCQADLIKKEKKAYNKDLLSSFTLQASSGRETHLPLSSKKLLVFVLLSPECPLSKNYSLKLSAIKKQYEKEAHFIGIIPGKFDAAEVVEFQRDYLSSWTIFTDNTLKLTHYLEGKVTPEVIVINNKNGCLIYKGAIDDWAVSPGRTRQTYSNFYLVNALSAFVNNKKILISYHTPVGCLINDF